MKKTILYLINTISIIAILISIYIMRDCLATMKVKDFISIPAITETEEFRNITQNKINNTFDLIDLKNKYEKNNYLNLDTKVATTYINNSYKFFTLNDIIDLSKANKIIIKDNAVIEEDPTIQNSNNKKYLYTELIYENETSPSSLLNNRMTEYQLCLKIMQHYCQYLMLSEEFNESNSNYYYLLKYEGKDKTIEYKNTSSTINDIISNKAFLYLSSDVKEIKSNVDYNIDFISNEILKRMPNKYTQYYFACGIDTEFKQNDIYRNVLMKYNTANFKYNSSQLALTIALIFFIITFIAIITLISNSTKKDKKSNFLFFRISTDIYITFFFIMLIIANFILPTEITVPNFNLYLRIAINYFIIFSAILFFNEKYINLCSEEPIFISKLYSTYIYGIRKITGSVPIFTYVLFYGIPLVTILFGSIYSYKLYHSVHHSGFFYIALLGFTTFILMIAFTFVINNGFINALNEKDKSEQMKLDLISNVSHDIRTPLTSIINYSDILNFTLNSKTKPKKEDIKHYTNIIYEKSNKLKTLIDDLIYSTKASSGNLDINMQKLDIKSFSIQYFTDNEDRLLQKKLTINKIINNKNIFIYADGEKLYRIFENLFSNLCKYAKEDTEIIFSVKELNDEKKVEITMQNESLEELSDDDSNNLIDRFVRGDKSRNKEGFGLGLSIVKDLVNLMHGKYELKIDKQKNLFTNIIIFDKYNGL